MGVGDLVGDLGRAAHDASNSFGEVTLVRCALLSGSAVQGIDARKRWFEPAVRRGGQDKSLHGAIMK